MIYHKLAFQMQHLNREGKVHFSRLFPSESKSKGTAGEALSQDVLEDGVTLEIIPMVRLPGESSHRGLKQKHLLTMNLHSVVDILAFPASFLEIKPGVFYIPRTTNFVSIDSFVVVDEKLILFQFTTSPNHDIKSGIFDLLQ